MERLNSPPFPAYTALLHLGARFLVGVVIVWLYAAIRPRFGPGPKTAFYAGLIAWFFAYFLFAEGMEPFGLFSTKVLAIITAWGLLETQLVAQVGAWLYQEA